MKKGSKPKKARRPLLLALWGIFVAVGGLAVALGAGLHLRFPDFDPLPLFGILAAAFALACVVNRVSAQVFARNHFGMPYEEMTEHLSKHDKACKEDPRAVLKQYEGMSTFPLFLLGVYFLMTFSLVVVGTMCSAMDDAGIWYKAAGSLGLYGGILLLSMPIFRLREVIPSRRHTRSPLSAETSPLIYGMAKQAAEAVGISGRIEIEMVHDCSCDVNYISRTYVVFLGTRLMAVLTREEMEQALLLAFSAFARPHLNRQVIFRYRLGLLGDAKVRPATFAFDLFFSYADATMEWEYDLYSYAMKRFLTNESYRLVQERGNVPAAMSVLAKKGFWSYYVFEYPRFMPRSYYETPTLPPDHEQTVCDGFRTACMARSEAWLALMSKTMDGYVHADIPFRYEKTVLDPVGRALPPMELPSPDFPYGDEVLRLIREKAATDVSFSAVMEYELARRHEYLEPLHIVEEYEQNPHGYSTPELSPVINGYRDIGKFDRAEALCDEILKREHNPFAMAHALYFKGMCMIHRYETEGIDLIYRAIDLNKNYMKDGFEMVGEYCVLCGLSDEYAAFRRRAEIQMNAHSYNQEGASYLAMTDYLQREDGLGDMLPDILGYMERVADGCIREIYLVRKVISEDFFTSAFVINFDYGVSDEQMRKTYSAIFNYLDAYPVDWQFSLFIYDRETERAVMRVEGSRVWSKKE